ncbi:MAG: type II secretion system protein [Betaproteobacteria bacterium]|nr:type II secretion system protein [Betaproteobacteria bacterium]
MTARFASPRTAGFSLIEMAIVLAIIGFVLGGMLLTLSAQVSQRNIDETQVRLRQARDALIGFAIANGRLPCPASAPPPASPSSNGMESVSGGTCTNFYNGFLPAVTLGFQPVSSSGYALDAWGNPIRYAVVQKITGCVDSTTGLPASPAISPFIASSPNPTLKTYGVSCQPNDLVICQGGLYDSYISATSCGSPPAPATNSVTKQNTVVAIVFSTGKDYTSMTSGNTDEQINLKNAPYGSYATFVSHPPAPVGASGGEFDDQLEWIPVGLLYGRMTAAGVLP